MVLGGQMPRDYLIDINISDTIENVIRKSNTNFKRLYRSLKTLADQSIRESSDKLTTTIHTTAEGIRGELANVSNYLSERINDLSNHVDEIEEAITSAMVTGVKGDAESSYRRGNVNLTPANIGASPTGHTHDAADTVSGEFAVARIPNLNANKITAGTLALARGGTASNNTDRAINTVFAGPSSGSAGNASWRKLAAADIPNLNASKITAGTFGIDRIPTITPAKGGTGRTSAQIATYTIFSGKNAGDGATLGTNTDVFNYRIFLVKLNNVGTYLIGYRTGNTSSAGYILAGNNEFQETAGGDKAAGCKISVSTAGLCKVVAAGYHKLQNNVAITTTSSNVTGVWGLY